MGEKKKIALIGNPNSGKTTLFNQLTGMHQHTSNFPGTTVSVKSGSFSSSTLKDKIKVIDFPGAYSFFANSIDEKLNVEILTNPENENYPDLILYVVDITKLSRHFLLASQVQDLKIPTIIILNMVDLVEEDTIKVEKIQDLFDVPVIKMSSRSGVGLEELNDLIARFYNDGSSQFLKEDNFYEFSDIEKKVIKDNSEIISGEPYLTKLVSHHASWLQHLDPRDKKLILDNNSKNNFDDLQFQIKETMARYDGIEPLVKSYVTSDSKDKTLTDKIDDIITHRVFGPVIFFGIMFFIFQAIFEWANLPMDLIEGGFGLVASKVHDILGNHWVSDLISEGVIPGLAGVFVFLPQIIMLFFFLALLEESGYMSRVVYMFDGLLSKFGLNGRSIVALISSGACAIPAIMSTRTISNYKERLITILVTPLISCSARIPVYTALIGFVVPSGMKVGWFNGQGLAFMGLYLLGVIAALLSALVFKWFIKSKEKSFLMLELPQYKKPSWKNIYFYVSNKVFSFIKEAGKIILLVSMILWFMASYGPGNNMIIAEKNAIAAAAQQGLDEQATDNLVSSKRIESSYVGILGKFIEPTVKPLGYDWKIGIALITSFAAREVFVGTMSTIYSIGGDDDVVRVRDRMEQQINPLTGDKVYNFATALSLLMFYVFALQCMSTLAVTYKETKSFKWPIVQFVFMGGLAYLVSFIVFQVFS